MCFSLYAGTTHPIPRKEWNRKEWNIESPDISVRSVQGNEEAIKVHFSKPEVQIIGSTSNCGCDFPSAMYQGEGWPEIEYAEKDEEQQSREQFNREGLVHLLSTVDEDFLELYGVWAGNYPESPAAHENIILSAMLDPRFCFKERGFSRVQL